MPAQSSIILVTECINQYFSNIITLSQTIMQINIFILMSINQLIQRKATGCPADLAQRLSVSPRTVHRYISYLREDLQLDIYYDADRPSYCYGGERELVLHLGRKEK